jgi:hypothetical protein
MGSCAVCQLTDGLIINIIVASPIDVPPDGCQLIATPDSAGNNAQIGGTWNGTNFVSIPTPAPTTPTTPSGS